MKDSIYILEAIATHYPDDTYPVVVERMGRQRRGW